LKKAENPDILLKMAYKVIEISTVTAEEIEKVLNEWTKKGWKLDRILFAMKESQKRPAMAFVIFEGKEDDE
jgi:hypothetical protein